MFYITNNIIINGIIILLIRFFFNARIKCLYLSYNLCAIFFLSTFELFIKEGLIEKIIIYYRRNSF